MSVDATERRLRPMHGTPAPAHVRLMLRRIAADEGATLQRLRWAALEDAPQAYAMTLAEARRLPLAHFERQAAVRAASPDSAVFFATHGSEVLGLIGAHRHAEGGRACLTSLWVAPSHRRLGAARRLVARAACWLGQAGADEVHVGVTTGNADALAFYGSIGFVPAPVDDTAPAPNVPATPPRRLLVLRTSCAPGDAS